MGTLTEPARRAGRPKSQGPIKDRPTTIRFSVVAKSELKRIASETGRSVSEILDELVTQFIERHPPSF